jgi:hypothetical protein
MTILSIASVVKNTSSKLMTKQEMCDAFITLLTSLSNIRMKIVIKLGFSLTIEIFVLL